MVARSAVRAIVVGEQRLVAALGARLDPVADKILLSPACSSASLVESALRGGFDPLMCVAGNQSGGMDVGLDFFLAAVTAAIARLEGITIGQGGIESMPDMGTDASRQELHALLDHIPESDVPTARKFLRSLLEPVELSLLTAPLDDEPETEEERAAVEAARREPGPGTPHEEVLREFGL